jgi:hypothetical protein
MPHVNDSIVIARTVQTCRAFPSQWDAWTSDGDKLYLRFRHGFGFVELGGPGGECIAEFSVPEDAGLIPLEDFCELADLQLSTFAEHETDPYT